MCLGINWNLCTFYAPVRLSSYATEKVKRTSKKTSYLYYIQCPETWIKVRKEWPALGTTSKPRLALHPNTKPGIELILDSVFNIARICSQTQYHRGVKVSFIIHPIHIDILAIPINVHGISMRIWKYLVRDLIHRCPDTESRQCLLANDRHRRRPTILRSLSPSGIIPERLEKIVLCLWTSRRLVHVWLALWARCCAPGSSSGFPVRTNTRI